MQLISTLLMNLKQCKHSERCFRTVLKGFKLCILSGPTNQFLGIYLEQIMGNITKTHVQGGSLQCFFVLKLMGAQTIDEIN